MALRFLGVEVDITAKKHKGNPHSIAAHKKTIPFKQAHKDQIYSWWVKQGPAGAITEDVLPVFGHLRETTVTARVSELKCEGKLVEIGVRPTRYSGCEAAVLVAYIYVGKK